MKRSERTRPTDKPSASDLDWGLLRELVPFLRLYSGRTIASLVLLVAAKVATVAVPMVMKQLVDRLDVEGVEVLVVPAALLVAYGLLRFASVLFRELQTSVFNLARTGIMREMSVRVVDHLHALSLRYHLQRRTGSVATDIARGTNSVSNLLQYLLFNIVPTLLEIAMVAVVLVAAYSVWFAVVCVVTFAVYVAATFAITQWRTRFRVEMNAAESKATADAVDGLLNYETVKIFGNERFEIGRYEGSLRVWEDASRKSQDSLALLNAAQGLVIAAGVTVTMWMAAGGVARRELSIGDLVAVNAYLIQIFVPLGFLGTIYSIITQALVDVQRMFALLKTEPEIRDSVDATELEVRGGRVTFEGVSFRYNEDRPILRDVSFAIEPGQRVAIVGPSGAGKSTIGRLLFRFWEPSGGRIRIDGTDIAGVTQASLRRALGVVPQDTVLFNDTLGYNIRYARLDATDAELAAAIDAAQLTPFIATLPQGLDTQVGERGLKLSGGEKQRVAIARALLKAPPILLFDEATSSLDSISEAAIVGALRAASSRRTTLVIAHRLSTVADADQILVLDAGVIAERGSHAELLALDGLYATLWRQQQVDEATTG